MLRANWHEEAGGEEADEGRRRGRVLSEWGLFLSEEAAQVLVEHLNAMEERMFGSDALFFYDYCLHHALATDAPF